MEQINTEMARFFDHYVEAGGRLPHGFRVQLLLPVDSQQTGKATSAVIWLNFDDPEAGPGYVTTALAFLLNVLKEPNADQENLKKFATATAKALRGQPCGDPACQACKPHLVPSPGPKTIQ